MHDCTPYSVHTFIPPRLQRQRPNHPPHRQQIKRPPRSVRCWMRAQPDLAARVQAEDFLGECGEGLDESFVEGHFFCCSGLVWFVGYVWVSSMLFEYGGDVMVLCRCFFRLAAVDANHLHGPISYWRGMVMFAFLSLFRTEYFVQDDTRWNSPLTFIIHLVHISSPNSMATSQSTSPMLISIHTYIQSHQVQFVSSIFLLCFFCLFYVLLSRGYHKKGE